jgi:C4-dicarboxylate transporter, DctQ subunit
MLERVRAMAGWFYRRCENLMAVMIGVMFAAFLLQVLFRYSLQWPTGWSNELTVVLWIWVVLFGAAFVVREDEEIRFDLVFGAVPRRVRRVLILASAVALIALYGYSLPAVVDYVAFMKVQSTAYLKIRFDWLFTVYVIFVVAVIVRYLWLGWHALRREDASEPDPTKASLGL